MAIIGNLIKKGIILRESIEQQYSIPLELQKLQLKKLLISARDTQFGKKCDFKSILQSYKSQNIFDFYNVFKKNLPVFDYDKIYDEWWYKAKAGEKDICWPGKIKYFALSSGTSGASSKYIPITMDQLKAIRKTSIRQILTLSKYSLPDKLYTTGVLMLGGSTDLKYNGTFFEGDLSGISISRIPLWFQRFYKPGQKIAKQIDWGMKIEEITKKAAQWNIGIIAGVPAWVQILLEKIIKYHNVQSIHDIWPNFKIFVHGGVAFEPYRKTFDDLISKPLIYIETYLASEGFLAFQSGPNTKGMKLVLNNGIFYEFIPFTEKNFDSNGEMKDAPETYMINEIEEDKEYAILISTCSGAWRYLIGDTIKLVDHRNSEIVITGRTKHFLSLCGEHLSVDNMNNAIHYLNEELQLQSKEFTVIGEPNGSLFSHHWYIGTEKKNDISRVKIKLDEKLKLLNDDYRVERQHALNDIFVDLIPNEKFYEFLKIKGKEGGQTKFPRVLKGNKCDEWKRFIKNEYPLP